MRIFENEGKLFFETEFIDRDDQLRGEIKRFEPNHMNWLNLLLLAEISERLGVLSKERGAKK